MSGLDDPSIKRWRKATPDCAASLVKTPDWHRAVDEGGRNTLMQAVLGARRSPLVGQMLHAAIEQGVLSEMACHEDKNGVRLASYLISANLALPGSLPGGEYIYQSPAKNSRGEGVFMQLAALAEDNISEFGPEGWLMRHVGATPDEVSHWSRDDWQAGLDGEVFRQWVGGFALANSVWAGVASTEDYQLLKMVRAVHSSGEAWLPVVANAIHLVELLEQLLLDLSDMDAPAAARPQVEALVHAKEVALWDFMDYLPPKYPKYQPIIAYFLAYSGLEEVWQGVVSRRAAVQLDAVTGLSNNTPLPARL